jgi:hypothetical protein
MTTATNRQLTVRSYRKFRHLRRFLAVVGRGFGRLANFYQSPVGAIVTLLFAINVCFVALSGR